MRTPFYSLLGVSTVVVEKFADETGELSTPFWEFRSYVAYDSEQSVPDFLLPFGSFRRV